MDRGRDRKKKIEVTSYEKGDPGSKHRKGQTYLPKLKFDHFRLLPPARTVSGNSIAFGLAMSTMGSERANLTVRRLLMSIIIICLSLFFYSSSPLRSPLSYCLFARHDLSSQPDVLYSCNSQESQRAVPCSDAVSVVSWRSLHVSDTTFSEQCA